MGDIKTFWPDKDQPFSGTDMGGANVVSRGSDPNADGDNGAGAGLKNFWDAGGNYGALNNIVGEDPPPSTAESSNSVSGLPSLPNRFEPAEKTIENIPDLTRRSPGTIDAK